MSTSAKCRLSVPVRSPSRSIGTRSETGSIARPGTSTNDARAGSETTSSSSSARSGAREGFGRVANLLGVAQRHEGVGLAGQFVVD